MGIPFLPYNSKKDSKSEAPSHSSKGEKKTDPNKSGGGSSHNTRKACVTCGKYHEGICNKLKKNSEEKTNSSSSTSSSSTSTNTPSSTSKMDKYKDHSKNKRKYLESESICYLKYNDDVFLQNEITLKTLSQTKHACEYPMRITTRQGNHIDIVVLIDTGANASNYISQSLYDRLVAEGQPIKQIASSVRSGLNTAQQQGVVCKSAISFPISFQSEIKCNCKLNNDCVQNTVTKIAIAKLLPIDYDLIIGLPSIRGWELIKHIPSIFLEQNKLPIGNSAGPCTGVVKPPIFASYADSLNSMRETEVVISDPPFEPSNTTWEDSNVSTRNTRYRY
jgi:hypothetical protein